VESTMTIFEDKNFFANDLRTRPACDHRITKGRKEPKNCFGFRETKRKILRKIKFSQKEYPEDLFSQKFSMDTADRDKVLS
jgi:hypothetical protein